MKHGVRSVATIEEVLIVSIYSLVPYFHEVTEVGAEVVLSGELCAARLVDLVSPMCADE